MNLSLPRSHMLLHLLSTARVDCYFSEQSLTPYDSYSYIRKKFVFRSIICILPCFSEVLKNSSRSKIPGLLCEMTTPCPGNPNNGRASGPNREFSTPPARKISPWRIAPKFPIPVPLPPEVRLQDKALAATS